ncbi:MAG: recombination regulator RecX [Thioalkalivibrio sp.]|nr:recombination regulator RecX [Thioalkalivibrio sp.]
MTTPGATTLVRIEHFGRSGLEVRLHLDRGDPVPVALEAFEQSGIGVGDPLTGELRRTLLDLDADVRARDAALVQLSYRARTRSELGRKLRSKGFDGARVDRCLDRLEERGLLDDAAVAAAFVRDRLRHRPRGRARLTSELRTKGVAAEVAGGVIDEVFEDEDVTDLVLVRQVADGWVARQGDALLDALASDDRTRERERAHRRLRSYLGRRGFRGDALRAGVEQALSGAAERER